MVPRLAQVKVRIEKQHKITLHSGSTFIKYKVNYAIERGDGSYLKSKRHRYYTALEITGKDRRSLPDKLEALLNPNNIFPIGPRDFREIKKALNTTIKFKTRIQ